MRPRSYIIGIGGPSCAGKSELAAHLVRGLPEGETSVITLDTYYRDLSGRSLSERAQCNFDGPGALDWPLFAKHLRTLVEGRPIDKPVYDFAAHTRLPGRERVLPTRFVLIEGILALSRRTVRALYDLRVFVTASDALCLARREARDVRERGRTRESVRAQYEATVRPMAPRYVLPTQRYADLVVSGEESVSASAAIILAQISVTVEQGVHAS